jgi:hypothetical protein
MTYYNKRAFGLRSERLREARAKYPHRMVRNHSLTPDPRDISPIDYGHFARFPASDGDEWLFSDRAGMILFMQKYGGTILGE